MRISHYDYLAGVRSPKGYGYTLQDDYSMWSYWHPVPLNYVIRFLDYLIAIQIRILRRIL
jgi:hypothetical protein